MMPEFVYGLDETRWDDFDPGAIKPGAALSIAHRRLRFLGYDLHPLPLPVICGVLHRDAQRHEAECALSGITPTEARLGTIARYAKREIGW